ncbi:guanylate kinase [bacterium]|nr:guanylate kinase [bacterium]
MMSEKKYPGFLLVISGPSGAGKGSVIIGLLKRFEDMSVVTSWTTRSPRTGEEDGVEYHFVTKEEFQQKVQEKGFLEWAIVYDQFYGTPVENVKDLIEQGKIAVLEIDVQGSRSVRTHPMVDEVSLFIVPPDKKTLEQRLKDRNTENVDQLERRLKEAVREVDEAKYFDYIIINDNLDTAIDDAEMAIRGEYNRSRWVYEKVIQTFRQNS